MSTASLNKKLQEVCNKLSEKLDKLNSSLNEKVNKLDKKLDGVTCRLNVSKNLFQEKWDEIQSNQLLKADKTEVEKLQARISKLKDAKKEQDKVLIMRESYEKRFNVLIHGIPEQEESAWETPLQTLCLIHTFMKKGLCIEDPTLIPIADYHRLPQRPIYDRTGARIMRPIIIKLTNASDKRKIYNNVKNLKAFNEERGMN